MTTKTGPLVRDLTPAEENRRRTQQGFKPREGRRVRVWRIDGLWNVWSPGPDAGTWWLVPGDDAARTVYAELKSRPDAAEGVVKQAMQGAICVRTQEVGRP